MFPPRTEQLLQELCRPTIADLVDHLPACEPVTTKCTWCSATLQLHVSSEGYTADGLKQVITRCPSCHTKIQLTVRRG